MPLSPEKLLGDFLRLQLHTREGQFAAAQRIVELVERMNLGTAIIFEHPERPDGSGQKYPLVKIISEFGPGIPGRSRTLMTWLGHLDTVDPHPQQRNRDPLVLVPVTTPNGAKTRGEGRGTVDMWGGNIAYLCALDILRQQGNCQQAIQIVLSSREEAGSEVLHQALEHSDIEAARVGATTEILVGDTRQASPLYRGRTGRIGINAIFQGAAPHSGAVDRDTTVIGRIAHRYYGRGMDELLDESRGYFLPNEYPGDREGVLPKVSHAIPGRIFGEPQGLSLPEEILQKFDIFHSDPNLAPERVRTTLETYLHERANIPVEALELRLEERNGVPFIDPWLTPADHPLVAAASRYADMIDGRKVPVSAASGVAEESMLFHRLGTDFIGWSPDGGDPHEKTEYVIIESIQERAEWLCRLAQHDGDLS